MGYEFYFEKLEVWKNARSFVTSIYETTKVFPSDEKYGLTSQIRRSALSIMANIAEGMSRKTTKEKKRFINIAYGSAIETLNFIIIAQDLNLITTEDYHTLRKDLEYIANQLNALHRTLG